MEKFYKGLIAFVFIGLVSFIIYQQIRIKQHNEYVMTIHNELASKSEIKELEDSFYSNVSYLSRTITTHTSRIEELTKKVVYTAKVTAEKTPEIIDVESSKSDTSLGVIHAISWSGQGADLEGILFHPKGTFKGKIAYHPINLDIYATQNDKGIWETFVRPSNKYIEVSSIKSEIVPYDFENNKNYWAMTGVGYSLDGRILFNASLGYKTVSIYSHLDKYGFGLGVQKLWYLR